VGSGKVRGWCNFKSIYIHCTKIIEEDGSVTLSLNEIDLVENGSDEQSARINLGKAILEYFNSKI
jgi:hypothetical protein